MYNVEAKLNSHWSSKVPIIICYCATSKNSVLKEERQTNGSSFQFRFEEQRSKVYNKITYSPKMRIV